MNPTPHDEWSFLRRKIQNGTATAGDKERADVLQNRIIDAAVHEAILPVLANLERQLPALRRKVAARQQQRRQPPMSAAQRAARDRILRQQQKR